MPNSDSSPSRGTAAERVVTIVLHTVIRLLSSSMTTMIPSKMESSNLNHTMPAPERQMNSVCCPRSQHLKHSRAARK